MSENKRNLSSENSRLRSYSAVLLIIDAQVDFLSPLAPYLCLDSEQVVERIAYLLEIFRSKNMPVIFTRETHSPNMRDYGNELLNGAPIHTVEGTPGFDIVPKLKPLSNEFIIDKRRYSAFLGTHLDIILNSISRPVLYITGFTTNCCVHYTAIEAYQRDYQVHVVRDCVSATSREKHDNGLRMLEYISENIPVYLKTCLSAIV